MTSFVDRLKAVPILGSLVKFADDRPRLAAWIVLSVGIVVLLIIEARDVGLLIGQWIALIVASILVAGLCIWIVTWEDKTESPADAPAAGATGSTDAAKTEIVQAKASDDKVPAENSTESATSDETKA